MEVFNCPKCGLKSTFDPWKESAHCPRCGYSPSKPGEQEDWQLPIQPHDDELSWVPDSAFEIHKRAKREMAVHLVLVREGDYLLTYGHDAQLVAQVCGTRLLVTGQLRHEEGPMARIPYKEREEYIRQLETAGFAVGVANAQISICPQCNHHFRIDDIHAPGGQCPMCDFMPVTVDAYIHDLLDRALQVVKDNDFSGAAHLLEDQVLKNRLNPQLAAEAWVQLADVTADLYVKQTHLKKALDLDPDNATAQRRMAQVKEIIYSGGGDFSQEAQEGKDMQPHDQEAEPLVIERFECPKCGGVTSYEPGVFGLVCQYCGYHQPIVEPAEGTDQGEVQEQSFYAAMASLQAHAKSLTAHIQNCPACGAKFILGGTRLSFNCPYCGAACAIERASYREILAPTGVMPFAIRQSEAERIIEGWMQEKRGRMLPQFCPVSGIYLSLWTFDMEGEITWTRETGGLGDLLGVPLHQRRGQKFVLLDDILVPASRRLEPSLWELVMEFDRSRLAPYDVRYLADFPAEHYEIALSDAAIQARGEAVKLGRSILSKELGGLENIHIRTAGLSIATYKLILIPVWLAHCRVEDEDVDILVHGQSGKIAAAKSNLTYPSSE